MSISVIVHNFPTPFSNTVLKKCGENGDACESFVNGIFYNIADTEILKNTH